DFGEAVVAVVVPAAEARLSAEAIIAACKSDLADFKVPKRIIFANELPRNAMSKVQKNVLRDQNVALFN
ncbi:MAG: AMP-binding enzyme, partial [Woeseiales bacterium]